MATTHTSSAPTSGLPFYVWEVPGKPISIQLYFDVVDRIQPDVMRGLSALKRRGAEVGGILVGRSEPGSPARVIVEDFEPVPSEYRTGPSYSPSENDRVAIQAAIARRRSKGGQTVVGFYRSHTRDELYMDDSDLALARDYFPGPENVFLLIRPFATRTGIGGFFFWEDGEIHRESTYLQFPFHRGELGGGEPQSVPTSRQDAERSSSPYQSSAESRRESARFNSVEEPVYPATRTSRPNVFTPPETLVRASRSSTGRRLLIPALVAVAGLAGFVAYRALTPVSAPVAADPAGGEKMLPLKLTVAEKQYQLDVSWDRNAPAVLQAKRGLLSISDGSNKRGLELSGAQLRTGRVLYSRISGDVALKLEVFADGPEPITESIRIVSTEPVRPVPEPPPVVPAAKTVVEKRRTTVTRPPTKRASARAKKEPAPPQAEAPLPDELQRPARR